MSDLRTATAQGVLEMHPRGYGFLRNPAKNFAPHADALQNFGPHPDALQNTKARIDPCAFDQHGDPIGNSTNGAGKLTCPSAGLRTRSILNGFFSTLWVAGLASAEGAASLPPGFLSLPAS